jgi:hypothetical protein
MVRHERLREPHESTSPLHEGQNRSTIRVRALTTSPLPRRGRNQRLHEPRVVTVHWRVAFQLAEDEVARGLLVLEVHLADGTVHAVAFELR